MLYMEKGERQLNFTKRQAAFHVSVCLVDVDAMLRLDSVGGKELYLSVKGGWYFVTGFDFPIRLVTILLRSKKVGAAKLS